VEAHRNRLTYLTKMLRDETVRLRALRKGQPVRIFNLGCGPAKEIQDFLAQHSVSNDTEFLLLDFNEETLASTSQVLETRKREFNRQTRIQTRKKSVQQILKDAVKLKNSPEKFDIVYCAGLFDYLTDSVCEKLLAIFYEMTAPGGLVVATNVADTNPSQGWMDYMLDWHLIYRSAKQFGELVPKEALPDLSSVRALGTGVNIVVEIRKP
jgi:extracellular factor (EF) 3-hydroxypalmitic acid methyl ester biosynthesis protein